MSVEIGGYLKIIKEASNGEDVRDAIVNCMNEINKDSAFDVTNTTIKSKLSQISKTYSAPSRQCWKQVTIEIEDDTSGETINTGNQTKYDFEVDNYTANGTYNAVEEHGENAVWGNITVNVDHSGEWDGIEDNVVISTGDLDENSTFSASTRGLTAFKSVTFSDVDPVKAGGGYIGSDGDAYFNIKFDPNGGTWSDGSKAIKEKSIKMNDSIDIGEKPSKSGYTFVNWSSPNGYSKARTSETVKANYENPTITPGEISDDWLTIFIRKGNNDFYPVGTYKTMDIDVTIPYSADRGIFPDLDEFVTITGTEYRYLMTVCFVKVGYGEDNSTSSWLGMLPVTGDNAPVPSHIVTYDSNWGRAHEGYNKADYAQSKVITWLNSVFLDYAIPSYSAGITAVKKSYRYVNELGVSMNRTLSSKIWLPSAKEIWITGYDDQPGYPYEEGEDLDRSIRELYTNAVGLTYFDSFYPQHDGETRKALFEKLGNGYSGTLRDMTCSNRYENVPIPHPMDTPLQNTTVIDGRIVSNNHEIQPCLIGFCM